MKVVVVGGGPAGMMAAIASAEGGAQVTLIEKNEKLGKKLFLTGKGRCNLTNSCAVEELFDNVVRNPKFMYSAFYGFDNLQTMDFFEKLGLKIKIERGNRVFPASDHSSDVIKVLSSRLKKLDVTVRLNTECTDFICDDNKIAGVIIKDDKGKKEELTTDALILATGGASYVSTGSDGKMLDLLYRYGISSLDFTPSLIPLVCEADYITSLQGISLKNVSVKVKVGKKVKYSGFGEMLFTHFGISGPLILSASAYLDKSDFEQGVKVSIDLKPALSEDELDHRIQRDFSAGINKKLSNIIPNLVPSKMTGSVLKLAGLSGDKKVNVVSASERSSLVKTLKNFEFTVSGTANINEAIISRGGICVKDINPATMQSKKIKGMYFAGEMIDVDALTGGFNLQIAWSTGNLAGISACGLNKK